MVAAGKRLHIYWTSGHTGTPGNEIANGIANTVGTEPGLKYVTLITNQIFHNETAQKECKKLWRKVEKDIDDWRIRGINELDYL